MKKILLVTHDYLSLKSPRSIRWRAIAEYWAGWGTSVDVVCSPTPGIPDVSTVNRVRVFTAGRATGALLRARLGGHSPAGLHPAGSLKSVAKGIHDLTWKKIYWPDYACLWLIPAILTARRLLLRNDYDRLISVSLPFTGHLVGWRIKKDRPGLNWLVDIGDPFCFMDTTPVNNRLLYKRLNYRVERSVLGSSNAIAVTTRPTLERYLDLFPELTDRMHVIPPLAPPVGPSSEPPFFPKDGKIRLVYAGRLYRNIRNPDVLLSIFAKISRLPGGERLELHFFGSLHDIRQNFRPYADLIGSRIHIHGLTDRETTIAAMQSAGILVNIGNTTSYQLPSKLIEYASLSKPIINIAHGEQDSSIAFLKTHPAAFNVLAGDREPDLAGLMRFIQTPPAIDKNRLEKFMREYSLKQVADAYTTLLS